MPCPPKIIGTTAAIVLQKPSQGKHAWGNRIDEKSRGLLAKVKAAFVKSQQGFGEKSRELL
jgi:hypothetical protein